MKQYRKDNLDHVRRSEFTPSGVSSETAAIAKALGSCLVNATDLQEQLVTLLKAHHQQRPSQGVDISKGVVIEAAVTLSRLGKDCVYAREIAVEANRLLEDRGETLKLNPEKVGHRLRKLGLLTRRLSKAGNGLVCDKATVATLRHLSEMYVGEDLVADIDGLHRPQATEKKGVQDAM